MAKIDRLNDNLRPFASNSIGFERTVFGSTTQSDDIDDNITAEFLRGWGIVGSNDTPTKQDFNALGYSISSLISYLYQQGMAEYNENQDYYINSFTVGTDGKLYRSKTGTDGSANNGNPLSDTVNWECVNDLFYTKTEIDGLVHSATSKTTPVDADEIGLQDSESSFSLKKLTWANLKATLKTYFDSTYAILASPSFIGTPTAPTATAGTNTTQLATTAFVNSEISNDVGVSNSALVKTALNASGTAPIYACRAWCNFNGTGTVAIRASGNVSSITDNGVGNYAVNFTTPMIDVNYSKAVHNSGNIGVNTIINISSQVGNTVSKTDIIIVNIGNNTGVDTDFINFAVFR